MSKVYVIAEAGINHNGNLGLAKKLVDEAAKFGADAIKFQTWKTELMVTRSAERADYQIENSKFIESQYDMLKKLELNYDNFKKIARHCASKKIIFLSTPDELESAKFLRNMQSIFKIGSGNVTNYPLLKFIGTFNKEVFLSTGMSTIKEISEAINVLQTNGTSRSKITLLHCTTEYPLPFNDVNLSAMLSLGKKFDLPIGYSDHTTGIEVAIAAVALGARVIEKHFTLDRKLVGPDHKASLEPFEMKKMIDSIRNIEAALGDGKKRVMDGEVSNKRIARKSIVAARNIKVGEIFSEDNITVKRPEGGISPMNWVNCIGAIAKQNFKKDDFIEL